MSTKWLHNKGWIPVSRHWDDTICCGNCSQITMFVQLWIHSRYRFR
ncbi:hypothetical protein LA754_05005 [Wolbachia endosymbiont of Muscidifurax uniraptor]|nr:hypothetical protein [Wolbachia pipientis]